MAPRTYRQEARAAATGETRRRILEASLALHQEKGFAATSWQDIAERAGVAVGTVYYHFPSFDELVPACSALAMEVMRFPSASIFGAARGTNARIRVLVRHIVRYYGLAAAGLAHVEREKHRISPVATFARERRAALDTLVREALGPAAPRTPVAAIGALLDFKVWQAFSERSVSEGVIVSTLTGSIERLLQHPPSRKR